MTIKSTITCAILSGTLIASTSALADNWSGTASLGAVVTSGNSETRNINGGVNVTKNTAQWKHTAFGSILNAENNDVETANRFDLGYKLDRKLNENTYVFGRVRYESDEFGNIDDRFSGVVGIGSDFFKSEVRKFSGEIGIGAQQTTFLSLTPILLDDGTVDPAQTALDDIEEKGATIYGGLKYHQKINQNLTFNSDFGFEAAEHNTSFVWDNSLGVKMSDKLSLSVGLLTRTNTDTVGALGEKTDTATRISLVYGL